MIMIRPEAVIITSNKSLKELLEDKDTLNNKTNDDALRNRIIEV